MATAATMERTASPIAPIDVSLPELYPPAWLLSRQARESGICPIREELHSQCFDEIIRQVTIDCPERGLLLMRVRDELKMTIAAYQTLYKSAVAFGMRKQIQAEKGKKDLEDRIQSLDSRKKELLEKVRPAHLESRDGEQEEGHREPHHRKEGEGVQEEDRRDQVP